MLLFEKESLMQEDNSLRSNSENDFKELDIEIDKVIRGEASLEEENLSTKIIASSPIHKKENKNSQKNNNKSISKERNKELNKINILEFLYKNQQRNSVDVDKNKSDLILSLINSDRSLLNNNLKFTKNINNTNHSLYMYNIINNIQDYEINNNLMNNGINLNYLNNSINKNTCYLNELIYLYNQKLNDCNNNTNNLNCFNINTNVNNTCTNNNVNTNMNVNNIPLLYILNSQLNDFQLKNIQKNNIKSNIIPNLNSLQNNYINNNYINNNIIENLLSMQMKIQLINNNINEFNQNLFLMSQIKNQSKLNSIYNTLNLMNKQSQIDLNFYNINNININDHIKKNCKDIQNNSLLFLKAKLNRLKQSNQNKNFNGNEIYKDTLKSKSDRITGNTYKRRYNQKLDLIINKNIINLMDIFLCKDLRTTLMIKNIPNKYTISSFLDEINTYFKFTYDIFYLPIDYVNKCNLGFAFINFVEPFHIILFHELYSGKKWKKFNSEKICELLYAKYQGKKELIGHFEKGKVLSFENQEKRPLILDTPNPLPKIDLPYYFFDLFIKIYPHISYEIKDCKIVKKNNKCKNNYYSQLSTIFSINGNFKMN